MIKRGFSLMEMMVVMLIVAVIAAASAPMISKKMVQNASSDSPWIWTSATENTIAFNLKGNLKSSATIGATKPPSDVKDSTMFHINVKGKDNPPMITLSNDSFKDDNGNPKSFFIRADKKNNFLQLSDGTDGGLIRDSIRIGLGQKSFDSSSAGLRHQVIIGNEIKLGDTGPDGNSSVDGFTALGNNIEMAGFTNATAVGYQAQAKAGSTVALGYNSQAQYNSSIAIGASADAMANRAIAIGSDNTNIKCTDDDEDYKKAPAASGLRSIAIGANAYSAYRDTIAIGSGTLATGGGEGTSYVSSVSIGHKANSTKSIAIGHDVSAENRSIAIGIRAIAGNKPELYQDNSIAIGQDAYAKGDGVIAIGYKTNLKGGNWQTEPTYPPGNHSIAIGEEAYTNYYEQGGTKIVSPNSATAIGYQAKAVGDYATALGAKALAFGPKNIAIGNYANATNSSAIGGSSIAIGHNTTASHKQSVAIGYEAKTTADNQIVLGTTGTGRTTTVYIPGNLVVDGSVVMGRTLGNEGFSYDGGRSIYMNLYVNGGGNKLNSLMRLGNDKDVTFKDKGGYSIIDVDDKHPLGVDFSDRRLKDVGEVFKGGLEEIKKLEVFNYTFKKDPNKTPRVGVMAQDLEKIFPKAVFKGDDGFLRIRMEDMFYALVNAVKELDSKIDSILSDVKTALNDIVDLKKKSAEYEKTISILVEQNKAQDKAIRDLEKRLAKLEKKMDKASKKSEVIEEVEE